jgi:hypothetical protein
VGTLGGGALGVPLIGQGVGIPPSFSSSPLSVTVGGTGQSSLTVGALLFGNGTDLVGTVGGTFGQILVSNGPGIPPSFVDAGGVLYASSGEIGSTGAGPDTLRTYTLPANKLVAGKKLRIQAYGYHNIATGTRTVTIAWGSNTVSFSFGQGGVAANEWMFDIEIHFVSATTQFAIVKNSSGLLGTAPLPFIRFATDLMEDTTAPIVISVLASSTTATADDIINEAMIVELA